MRTVVENCSILTAAQRSPDCPDYVYIGRRGRGMHFGNPFSHLLSSIATVRVSSRAESITAFRKWLLLEDYLDVEPQRRDWIIANMHMLRGKRLGCFCHPLPCHGDVYVEILEGEEGC